MSTDAAQPKCHRCRGELIRRDPVQLFITGALMCASLALVLVFPLFWIPGIILCLAGAYLIAWATFAKGLWCRQCKTFSR